MALPMRINKALIAPSSNAVLRELVMGLPLRDTDEVSDPDRQRIASIHIAKGGLTRLSPSGSDPVRSNAFIIANRLHQPRDERRARRKLVDNDMLMERVRAVAERTKPVKSRDAKRGG